MSRVLITGGSGRLGQSVVRGFAESGNEVISVDTRSVDGLPAEQVTADLTDISAVHSLIARHRPEAIVHLAAIAVPFSAPEHHILSTNVSLAYNVMGSGVALGVERIVTASSPTVLGYGNPRGWKPKRLPLDEGEPVQPWNAYAESKLFAESIARMFAAASGSSVRLASFRPCYVIAEEEWLGAPTQQGNTVAERLADPSLSAPALFNYVDARDVSIFLEALLDHIGDIPNAETFFVGASDALALEPLSDLLPLFEPGTEGLASALTGTSPAFSIAKASALLGWAPRYSWRTIAQFAHNQLASKSSLSTLDIT